MSARDGAHPWQRIGLGVYEEHMSEPGVGQLQQLHTVMREQFAAYPARTVAVLGVAGGNGLDLLDPVAIDAVYGFDINSDYLANCATRYGPSFRATLHLIEGAIDRSTRLEPVDLVIANLIVEYVGLAEFVAFAVANSESIGVLSCVVQHGDDAGFVSASRLASAFDGLAAVSSDVNAAELDAALTAAGFELIGSDEYPLPNGKFLVRRDFRAAPA